MTSFRLRNGGDETEGVGMVSEKEGKGRVREDGGMIGL